MLHTIYLFLEIISCHTILIVHSYSLSVHRVIQIKIRPFITKSIRTLDALLCRCKNTKMLMTLDAAQCKHTILISHTTERYNFKQTIHKSAKNCLFQYRKSISKQHIFFSLSDLLKLKMHFVFI